MQGPNVRRLIAHKISLILVPPGQAHGVGAVVAALTEPGRVAAAARDATAWAEGALKLVREAPGNTYPDDEAIAGAILARLDAKGEGRAVQ